MLMKWFCHAHASHASHASIKTLKEKSHLLYSKLKKTFTTCLNFVLHIYICLTKPRRYSFPNASMLSNCVCMSLQVIIY